MSYENIGVTTLDLINPEKGISVEDIEKLFFDFIQNYKGKGPSYYSQLHANLTQNINTLKIQLDHINSYDNELYTFLTQDPINTIRIFEQVIIKQNPTLNKFQIQIINVGRTTKIREISSCKLNKIITVEGIVVSASSIITKPRELYIECKSCNEVKIVKDVIPRKCSHGIECPLDPFIIIPEKTMVDDVQYIKIQELFEDIPMGETPRCFSLQANNLLTNLVTPGCKVKITGVLCIRNKGNQCFNFLQILGIEREKNKIKHFFSESEEIMFKTHFTSLDSIVLYYKIARSIAPTIFGKDDVKKALACMLFGGTRKEGKDGINLRGDINILLLGDPGIAKSQFLKFIEQISPIAVYTSGKSSSAAGLTATVLKDKNNEFYLEGGALVLADKGICCIDEFDKMNEYDRVAIHEAMEQQTISIAKAGITTVLNTRTAILAAANPVFGRYDDYKTPAENIEFGSTILSRFDMIFILKDMHDERDKDTAQHVLQLHINSEADEKVKKYKDQDIFPLELLRNYVQYAKSKCNPVLSEDAANKLNRFYINARQQVYQMEHTTTKKNSIPITIRQLEAIIRISESLAKMELSNIVKPMHVEEAIRLFQLSTMNAVSQGHQIEGMQRNEFLNQILDIIEKIKEILPIGCSKKFVELIKFLNEDEKLVKKAVEYMIKQNKLIIKEHGKVLVRIP